MLCEESCLDFRSVLQKQNALRITGAVCVMRYHEGGSAHIPIHLRHALQRLDDIDFPYAFVRFISAGKVSVTQVWERVQNIYNYYRENMGTLLGYRTDMAQSAMSQSLSTTKYTNNVGKSANDTIVSLENSQTPIVESEKETTENVTITLEYITELQAEVSAAMSKGELPFVSSAAVYENPYRLHVTVSSNSEENLAKLEAFDTIGGALEIEFNNSMLVLE